jgi:hypothetical protein
MSEIPTIDPAKLDKAADRLVEREFEPQTGHTPGPWRIGGTNPNHSAKVYGSDDWLVADTCGIKTRSAEEEAANARLIAAAPDLLAAVTMCEAVLAEHEQYDPDPDDDCAPSREHVAAEACRAAMTKANTLDRVA